MSIENYLDMTEEQSAETNWNQVCAQFSEEGLECLFEKARKFNIEALEDNRGLVGDSSID